MKRYPLGNHGLAWVLLVLLLGSWAVQTWTGWQEFVAQQYEHQQTAEWFGDDGYVWNWGRTTFENWQSEFLQLLTFVILTAYLVYKGSAESKDGDDEMQETLARIERRLDELAAGRAYGGDGVARSAGAPAMNTTAD